MTTELPPPETHPLEPKKAEAAQASAHGHHDHGFPLKLPFLEEFKRRNLVRVAILYIVLCYIILEPFEVLFHLLEMPVWAGRGIVLLMVMGFPAVLVFAWIYEVTPDGLKPTAEVSHGLSIREKTGKKLDRAIIAVLSLALVYFVTDKFWLSKRAEPLAVTTNSSGTMGTGEETAVVAKNADPTGVKSIAVLPFIDMSERHDQEYFSDGLTEELIDHLCHAEGLRVIARTSAFQFKGKNADVREIAAKLGVQYLLEGSVRRSRDMLRITAQLIGAGDGAHIWSQTFIRKDGDIFKIQDEISNEVSRSLKSAFDGSKTMATERAVHSAVFDLYLQGRFYETRSHAGDDDRALDFYSRAVQADPGFADALVRIAMVKFGQAQFGRISTAEASAAGHAALQRALASEPESAKVHLALGFLHFYYDWDDSAAETEFARTEQLDPMGDVGHVANGQRLWIKAFRTGDFNKVLVWISDERIRNPCDPGPLSDLMFVHHFSGEFEEEKRTAMQILDMDKDYAGAEASLALALLYLGEPAEALEAAKRESAEQWKLNALAVIYWALGKRDLSDKALKELEAKFGATSPSSVAESYAGRGEPDAAFHWLNVALRQRDSGMRILKVDPQFRSLRGDPRFQEMLRAAHLS